MRPDGSVLLAVTAGAVALESMERLRDAFRSPGASACRSAQSVLQAAPESDDGHNLAVAVFEPGSGRISYATRGPAGVVLAVADGLAAHLPQSQANANAPATDRTLTLPPRATIVLSTKPALVEHVIRDELGRRSRTLGIARSLVTSPARVACGATLALTLGGSLVDRFACALPAIPFAAPFIRATVRAFARAGCLDDESTFALQTAVGEAVANAIEHAYRQATGVGLVSVCGERREGVVMVRVDDDGDWRPEREVSDLRGRGLTLMRALVDAVDVRSADRRTSVHLTLRREPAAS